MKKIVLIFLIVLYKTIYSQTWVNVTSDYIYNPSFEEYYSCPQNTSDPSNYWIDSCKYWSHATYASPDYHNACQNALLNPLLGVPINYVMKNQMPFHGNGYLGFYAYSLINFNMWCEYVQSSFIKKLITGKKYKLQMRIIPSKHNSYGVSKIGVHLSTNSLSNNTQQSSFKFSPTMLNSQGIIDDTTKWFLFNENFTATGLENNLTIGWFADTVTSDNGYFDTTINQLTYGFSYYAIDSLILMEYNADFDIEGFNINIMTPNGDGLNDIMDFSNYKLNSLNFEVYNRWGNKVFYSQDVNIKWVGKTIGDTPLNDGVYYYIIKATLPDTKENIIKTGHISLIH